MHLTKEGGFQAYPRNDFLQINTGLRSVLLDTVCVYIPVEGSHCSFQPSASGIF